jgi:hypothetical protein
VQCLWTLPQNEWHESTVDQAQQKTGKNLNEIYQILSVFGKKSIQFG